MENQSKVEKERPDVWSQDEMEEFRRRYERPRKTEHLKDLQICTWSFFGHSLLARGLTGGWDGE